MSSLTVGTSTPVQLPMGGSATPLMQNLGPGTIYWANDPAVTVAAGAHAGVALAVNAMYQFPSDLSGGAGAIYLISSASATDVRILAVG